MNERKYEFVKSMRLAGFLMWRGFKLLEMRPLKENPNMEIYKFLQTPELTKSIFEYIEMRKHYDTIRNNTSKDWSTS